MLTLVSENPHGSERFEGFEISGMHCKLRNLRDALAAPKAKLTNSSDFAMKPRPFIGFIRLLSAFQPQDKLFPRYCFRNFIHLYAFASRQIALASFVFPRRQIKQSPFRA